MNDNIEIEINLKNDPIEMEIESNNSIIIREENVIESISVNRVEQPVDENKNVDITVPTKISDLTNDNNTVQDANYVHTDNNFTTSEKTKLANLENYDDTEIKADIQELDTNKTNKNETYTKTETDALLQGKADTEDIPDVSEFITRNVNDLTNYTLKTNTGSLIDLEINSTTYVVTLRLKDIDGNVISTDTIDLPLESVVVSGRYDNTTKKVILTLENGSEVDFSVADLVAGLQTEITSTNKLASDLVDDTNSGNKFTNTTEKQTWNNKYDKPSGGIPKTDLASAVQTSLGKADTALQTHQDISGKEDKSNKVTEINETSTDTQYPSAKAVHNKMANLGTTKTASGTSIDITDSAEGNMPLGIKGNTSQQTYTGINILDPNKFTTNAIAENIDNTTNVITLKQNNTENFCRIFNDLGLPAGNYTIWCEVISGTYNGGNLCFYDLNNTQYATEFSFKNSSRHYINLNLSTGLNRLQIWDTRCSTEVKIKIWILSGTYTTETMPDYEPYVGGTASPSPSYPQEVKTVTGEVNVKVANEIDDTAEGYQEQNYPINLGKNLAKVNDYELERNTFSIKANNGYVEFQATSTNVAYNITGGVWLGQWAQSYTAATDYYLTPEDKSNYILKVYFDKIVCSTSNACIFYIHTNQRRIEYSVDFKGFQDYNINYFTLPITLQENEHIKQIAYWNSGNISNIELNFHIQLERGSTATEYAPYFTPIELCKIGDEQDYIHKDNGKWYKHKEIGKYTFTGNETFNKVSEGYYMYFNANSTSPRTVFCNSYTNYLTYASFIGSDYGISLLYGGTQLYIRDKDVSTASDLVTKLVNSNAHFYYRLATPIEEEITEPTLIAQLEAMYNNAKSYEGETHIFTITENESPYIEAEYSIDNIENTLNKVTSIDENSTNKEYPSAKAVYDYGQSIAYEGEVYSTEEQVIGKWIDGKPLYRKVYNITSPSTINTSINVGDLPQNYDIIYIEKAFLIAVDSIQMLNFVDGTNNRIWLRTSGFSESPNKITMVVGANKYTNLQGYVVIEYTKTTD